MGGGFRRRAKTETWEHALDMRMAPTRDEAIIWERLKGLRDSHGLKFRFQQVILGWIADFYCPSRRIVVEIDGGYHNRPAQAAKDSDRARVMAMRHGITTIRFRNGDDPDKCIERIIALALRLPVYKSGNQRKLNTPVAPSPRAICRE